jgi:hypothetical protein
MKVHCKRCNHEWSPLLRLPMSLDRAIDVMLGIAAAGCPRCLAYGDDVLVGPAAQPRPPVVSALPQSV